MRPNSTTLDSITAAQMPSPGDARSTAFLKQLARGLRINRGPDSEQSSCPQVDVRKNLVCLTATIAQIELSARAGDGAVRSCSERFAAIHVALENMSAAHTATHDRDFALQIARLTKAQMLSLAPLRPNIDRVSIKRD